MGLYQRTPQKVTRATKYPGLGVRSVGPVGDFLDGWGKKKLPKKLEATNPLMPEKCRLSQRTNTDPRGKKPRTNPNHLGNGLGGPL